MLLVLGRLIGKDRLFHFDDLEEDPLLTTLSGVRKLPDFMRLYKDLERYRDEHTLEELKQTNARRVRTLVGREVVLDLD